MRKFRDPVRLVRDFYSIESVGRRGLFSDDEPYGHECGLSDQDVLDWCRAAWDLASPGQRRSLEHMWRQPGWEFIRGTYPKDEAIVNRKTRDLSFTKPPLWRIRVAVWRARPQDGNVRKWVFGINS